MRREVFRWNQVPLIVSGVLTLFFGIVWTHWPLLAIPSTFIYVFPAPSSPGEVCYGGVLPFPYPSNCPTTFQALPSPFDTLPFLPIIYFAVGVGVLLAAFIERSRYRILMLALSAGLVLTALGSNLGYTGNQGWPINWFLYPISHQPLSNYYPVYIVLPYFLADWAIFSLIVWGLWILSRVVLSSQEKAAGDNRPQTSSS